MTAEQLTEKVLKLECAYASVANLALLHSKDLQNRYGKSDETISRWVKEGRLPCPVRFTGPMWRVPDLEAAEVAGRLPRPVSA